MAADNKTIGRFQLVGIPPAPRGVPQIEVKFNLDRNGILNVSAKDLGTGKEQNITIKASSGLSDNEIDQMVKDAETHASEDTRKKEKIEAKNNAENLVYQAEKTLKEHKDKIPADKKGDIEKAVNELKDALKSDDTENIKQKTESLMNALHAVSSIIYQKTGQDQTPPEQGNKQEQEGNPDNNVVDADFKVVDDDKENNGKNKTK